MATIVMGVGSSHNPLLLVPGELWGRHPAKAPQPHRLPAHGCGQGGVGDIHVTAERGGKYGVWCSPSHWSAQSAIAQRCLQRITEEIAWAGSDIVLIVGNDDDELFGRDNVPAISVYHGADVAMRCARVAVPGGAPDVPQPYGMGTGRVHKGAPLLARSLIAELLRQDVDVAAAASVPDPTQRGFGHAFEFVAERLLAERQVPILPIVLNTHSPPNILSARRCCEIGRKLRRAIEAWPSELNVTMICAGGPSHCVGEETLGRELLDAFRSGDIDAIGQIPDTVLLKSGTSEMLTWLLAAGAVEHLAVAWDEYLPVYQTPAGAGVGLAFMVWNSSGAGSN